MWLLCFFSFLVSCFCRVVVKTSGFITCSFSHTVFMDVIAMQWYTMPLDCWCLYKKRKNTQMMMEMDFGLVLLEENKFYVGQERSDLNFPEWSDFCISIKQVGVFLYSLLLVLYQSSPDLIFGIKQRLSAPNLNFCYSWLALTALIQSSIRDVQLLLGVKG